MNTSGAKFIQCTECNNGFPARLGHCPKCVSKPIGKKQGKLRKRPKARVR